MNIISFYRNIFSDKELPYAEFGFTEREIAEIKRGNLPSQEAFEHKIADAYKRMREQKDFDPAKFRKAVVEMYRDFRNIFMSGKPMQGLQEKLYELELTEEVLTNLVKEKQNLKDKLHEYPSKAIAVLEEALERSKIRKALVKASDEGTSDEGTSDEKTFEIITDPRVRYDNLCKELARDLDVIKEALNTLRSKRPESEEYKHALFVVRRQLDKDIVLLNENIREVKRDIEICKNRMKLIGTRPVKKVIKAPVSVSPLGDISDAFLMMKLHMTNPPRVQEAEKSHHYEWLFKPSLLRSMFNYLFEREIEDKPEQLFKYKGDITVDVEAAIKDNILRLSKLLEKLSEELMGPKNIFEALKPEDYAYITIPEDVYEKYKAFLAEIKGKHSEEDFRRFLNFNLDTASFYHKILSPEMKKAKDEYIRLKNLADKGGIEDKKKFEEFDSSLRQKYSVNDYKHIIGEIADVPAELAMHREKLEKFFNSLSKILYMNQKIFEEKWRPLYSRLKKIKDVYSKFKTIYNAISKDAYWRTWLKGGIIPELRPSYKLVATDMDSGRLKFSSAITYKSSEEGYANVLEAFNDLKQFVQESKDFLDAKDFKTLQQVIREKTDYGANAEVLTRWVEDLGKKIQATLTAITNYRYNIEDFIHSLMMGNVFRKTKRDSEVTVTASAVIYNLRRLAFKLLVPGKAMEERSEYGVSVPLKIMGKTKGRWLEFFQKSFPVEGILKRFVEISGGTLDAKKLPEIFNYLKSGISREIARAFDRGHLEKEVAEYKKRLEAAKKKMRDLNNEIDDTLDLVERAYDKIDKAIENYRALSEPKKDEFHKLLQRQRALKEVFDESKATHLTPEFIRYYLKEMKKIKDEMTKFVDLDMAEDPFGGKTHIENLMRDAARLWNIYNDKQTRNLNWIKELQDETYRLQVLIARHEEWLSGDIPEEDKNDIEKMYMAYLWNIIDFNWQGRGKVKEFQTHYNVNFEDYLKLKDAFESIVGCKLISRSLMRMREETKKNIKYLKEQEKEVPKGQYEFLEKSRSMMRGLKEVKQEKTEKEASIPAWLPIKVAYLFSGMTKKDQFEAILS